MRRNDLDALGVERGPKSIQNRNKQKTNYPMSHRALDFAGPCEQSDEPAGSVRDISNSATVSFKELN